MLDDLYLYHSYCMLRLHAKKAKPLPRRVNTCSDGSLEAPTSDVAAKGAFATPTALPRYRSMSSVRLVASLPIMVNLSATGAAANSSLVVVEELLANVHRWCCGWVVLHLNALSDTPVAELAARLRSRGLGARARVVFNPQQLLMRSPSIASPSSLMDILLSNYYAATSELGRGAFSHVVQITSNERYVRPGAAEHVLRFDAGLSAIPRFGCKMTPDGLPRRIGGSCRPHGITAAQCANDPLARILATGLRLPVNANDSRGRPCIVTTDRPMGPS